ncbi:MAG: hypothetical protein K6T83_11715 [Alicyclobacillus sp.]|nr:hypothetical protein [Alicyclobacillus sp.]
MKPNPTGDVEHSSFLYFIDPQGREQFIANPDNVKSTITEWGDGIAYFVKRLG